MFPQVEQYRCELLCSQNKYPYSQFLSPEPHVRNRQINSMVSAYAKRLEKEFSYKMKYGEFAPLVQNLQTLLNKCRVKLGKMIIK